jgi:hypothetical protein
MINKRFLVNAIVLLFLELSFFVIPDQATAPAKADASWFDSAWHYRNSLLVSNLNHPALSDYQVLITIGSSFDFSKAKSDGSDIRFTLDDGVTLLPFWIETWNPAAQMARLWVKVPSIPANGTQTLYMYYSNNVANGVSSGNNTFDFFDDFESSSSIMGQGYYSLSSPQTVLQQSEGESSPPHMLSVIQAPSGPYAYWGYYGLVSCDGIWMAHSDNLVNWVKDGPLFIEEGERWPSVLPVDGTIYMAYTRDYCGTSHIVLRTSNDGINFGPFQVLVGQETGRINQNPNLFRDPNTNLFYLYWASSFGIKVRSATTIAGLATAQDQVLFQYINVLAAPNMLYNNGTYFLSLETNDGTNANWSTWIYTSTSPTGPFQLLPDNPILIDGSACLFQHVFGGTLHDYYCKITGGIWTVDYRSADLTAERPQVRLLDPSRWTPSSGAGAWTLRTTSQQDGTVGLVAQGSTLAFNTTSPLAFTGSDYVLETYGRLVYGQDWGIGIRSLNTPYSQYTATLNARIGNLVLFRGSGEVLASTDVGQINLNTWYKMTIKAHSNSLQVYLNDTLKLEATDDYNTYPSGGITMWGEEATVAQFNNVLVRKYAADEPMVTIGPEEGSPTPVQLSQVNSLAMPQGILLSWQTAQESDLVGFNVCRADTPEGSCVQVNPELIPAVNPGQLQGDDYQFIDKTAEEGKGYYYWIEWVGRHGNEYFGPVKGFLAPYWVWLPVAIN